MSSRVMEEKLKSTACLPGTIIDKTQNQQVAGYIRQFGFYPVDKAYLSTVQVNQPNQVSAPVQDTEVSNLQHNRQQAVYSMPLIWIEMLFLLS